MKKLNLILLVSWQISEVRRRACPILDSENEKELPKLHMLTYIIKNNKITGYVSMKKYIQTSLEIHLFFGRIMKEHALFLQAAFPAGEKAYMNKADWYRAEFEKILSWTVQLADGIAGKDVLCSGEVFTEFTVMAEQQSERLTKIPIDSRITRAAEKLKDGCGECLD